jgi:hypothetical protein
MSSCPQCVLRLLPHVRCDAGMTAYAVVTLLALGAGFPAVCSWVLWQGEARTQMAAAVRFLLRPVRPVRWRPL